MNTNISVFQISDLAKKLNVDIYQINLWLKNRRTKWIKNKDIESQNVKNFEEVNLSDFIGNADLENNQLLDVSVNVKRLTYREILNHTKSQNNPFREVQHRKGVPSANIKPNIAGISIGK